MRAFHHNGQNPGYGWKLLAQRLRMLRVLGISLCCFWVALLPSEASAALYRWFDAQGQVHYATTPPTFAVDNLEIKQGSAWRPYRPQEVEPTPRVRPVDVPTNQPQAARAEIPYRKQQNIILVQATLNHTYTANFMIDTGATYTIIASSVAETLNLRPDPDASLMTLQAASGEILAPLVNIDEIRLGEIAIPNVMAAIHDVDPLTEIAGVIGLNLLNRFTMTVDSSRHTLVLEAIQPLSEYANRNCAEAHKLVDKGQKPNVQPEQEISYYREAIALCQDFVEAYMHLAEVYYFEERYQDAIAQYLALLQFIPDDANAHYQLGFLYAMAGQYFQARQEFQKTLDLDPNHHEARESLEKLTP